MYTGSSNGLFRIFPGAHWNEAQLESFRDPRSRWWYSLAATGPTVLTILIDARDSASFLTLKSYVLDYMISISPADFFNVIFLKASSAVLPYGSYDTCFGSQLVPGTHANWCRMYRFVSDFTATAGSQPNWQYGANLAADMIQNHRTHYNCDCSGRDFVVVVTHGLPRSDAQILQETFSDTDTRLFIFSLEDESSSEQAEVLATCATEGMYVRLASSSSDLEDGQTRPSFISNYISDFFATGIATDVVWTPTYYGEVDTKQWTQSAAGVILDPNASYQQLIGVVAVDFILGGYDGGENKLLDTLPCDDIAILDSDETFLKSSLEEACAAASVTECPSCPSFTYSADAVNAVRPLYSTCSSIYAPWTTSRKIFAGILLLLVLGLSLVWLSDVIAGHIVCPSRVDSGNTGARESSPLVGRR